MASTPAIQAPKAAILAVVSGTAAGIKAQEGGIRSVYNRHSETIAASSAGVSMVQDKKAVTISAQQGIILAVVGSKVQTARLWSWPFSLDGHDFFVLKLGTERKTLVYDLYSKQWAWWATGDRKSWRGNVGFNWAAAGDIPFQYGSNVVVGDDSSGTLWVLDPRQSFDDSLTGEPQTFPREATAMIPVRGRESPKPVYTVQLVGNYGNPGYSGAAVELTYSDDQGRNYISAGTVPVEMANYGQDLQWLSLGMATTPGRVFKVKDDGALIRLDGLYVNEDEEEGQ